MHYYGTHKGSKILFHVEIRCVSHRTNALTCLTHFSPCLHFYIPGNVKKTFYFLTFSMSIEIKHWSKLG